MSAADRIAETMQRLGDIQAQGILNQGNAQAQAQANSGQIWSHAISNLGQLPGQVLGQMQQVKANEQEQQVRQLQIQRAQQIQDGEKGAQALLSTLPRTDDGTYDVSAAVPLFAQHGLTAEQTQNMVGTLDALNKATLATRQVRLDHAADLADTALQTARKTGEPLTVPGAVMWLAGAQAAGIANPSDVEKIKQALLQGTDPTELFTVMRNQGSKYKPKPITNETEAALAAAAGDPVAQRAMQTLKPPPQPTAATLAMQASGGDPAKALTALRTPVANPETERHNQEMEKLAQQRANRPPTSVNVNTGDASDVKEAIKGMKDGSLPPVMPGRGSKEYTALMAEAHRQGFDLSGAATDWAATQKHIATLNGAQQTRLNQAVNQLPELLDSVEGLAKQWKGGNFPLLNKANLALAKNGAFGKNAATIANQLDAQIADVNADLATVYMGGNSPTDRGLELASKALNSNWDQTVLLNMVQQARSNVQIRQNSIRNTGVQGASPTNPYAPTPPPAATTGGRLRVVGPNGETGTVPAGTALPAGWKAVQ